MNFDLLRKIALAETRTIFTDEEWATYQQQGLADDEAAMGTLGRIAAASKPDSRRQSLAADVLRDISGLASLPITSETENDLNVLSARVMLDIHVAQLAAILPSDQAAALRSALED